MKTEDREVLLTPLLKTILSSLKLRNLKAGRLREMSYSNLKNADLQAEIRRRQIPGRSKLTAKAAMVAALEKDDLDKKPKTEPKVESVKKTEPKSESVKKTEPKTESVKKTEPKVENVKKTDPKNGLPRQANNGEIEVALKEVGIATSLRGLISEYNNQAHTVVWVIPYEKYPVLEDYASKDELYNQKSFAAMEAAMVDLGIIPRRGDIIVLETYAGSSESDRTLIFDDHRLMKLDDTDSDSEVVVPVEFQVITEFPIGYWSAKDGEITAIDQFRFDQSKQINQLVAGIKYKLVKEDDYPEGIYALMSSFDYKGKRYEIFYDYCHLANLDQAEIDETDMPDLIRIFKEQLNRPNQVYCIESDHYSSKPNRIFLRIDNKAEEQLRRVLTEPE